MWRRLKQFFTYVCLELLDYPAGSSFWIYWVREVKKLKTLGVKQCSMCSWEVLGLFMDSSFFVVGAPHCDQCWTRCTKTFLISFHWHQRSTVWSGAKWNEQAAAGLLAGFCNCHHKNLDHRKIMNHHFDNSKAVKKPGPSKFQCSFQVAAKKSTLDI